MTLFSSHPRLTTAILILMFISFIFFANWKSANSESLFNSMGFHRLGSDYLAESLTIEEEHYQKMLDRRQDLIKKWGPTADKINSFPAYNGQYTIWDFFVPSFNCPHSVERIGTMGNGGKWVCGLERITPKKKCVVYSFGINGESSFEADVMKVAPGCEIYGYDFSVNSFGPEIELESDLKHRAHFFPYALGPKDAFSPVDNPRMYTLRTLMEQNSHDFIDVLKIDIEGNEFESLEVFVDSFHGEPLPFGQLQLEVHAFGDSEWAYFPKFLKWWEKLEEAGLRPFSFEPNLIWTNSMGGARPNLVEYSFINIRGSHELISDNPLPHPHISQ